MNCFRSDTLCNTSRQVYGPDAFCWVSRIGWQVWSSFTIALLVKSENKQWDIGTVYVALHGSLVWFHRWPSCNAVTHLAKLPWWLIAIDIDKLVINEPKSAQIQLIPVSSSKRLVSLFDHEFFCPFDLGLSTLLRFNLWSDFVIFHVSVSITWTLDMLCKTGNIKTMCLHLFLCLPCLYAPAYINRDETLREGPFFFVNQPLLGHVCASCCLLVGVEKMWKSNIFQTCPSQ